MPVLPPKCQDLPADIRSQLERFYAQIADPAYWLEKEGERKNASNALKNYLKRLQYFGVYESDEVQWVEDLEAAKAAHQASLRSAALDETRELAYQSIQSTADLHGRSEAIIAVRNDVRNKIMQQEHLYFTSHDRANAADDASLAAAWVVVSDLQLEPSPFEPLMQIWQEGFWPIGPLAGKFVLFAPSTEVRNQRREHAKAAAPAPAPQPAAAPVAAPAAQAPAPQAAPVSENIVIPGSDRPVPSGDGWSIQLDWGSQSEVPQSKSETGQKTNQTAELLKVGSSGGGGPQTTIKTQGLPASPTPEPEPEPAYEPPPEPPAEVHVQSAPATQDQMYAPQPPQQQMYAPQHGHPQQHPHQMQYPQQGYPPQDPMQQGYPQQPMQQGYPMQPQQAGYPPQQYMVDHTGAPIHHGHQAQMGHPMTPSGAYPHMGGQPYPGQPSPYHAPQGQPMQGGYPQQAPVQAPPRQSAPPPDPFASSAVADDDLDPLASEAPIVPPKPSRTGLYLFLILLLLGGGGGGWYFYSNSPGVLFQEATRQLNDQKFAQAEALLRVILQKDPKLPGAQRSLGLALMQIKRDKEALEAFQEAVKQDPKDGLSNLQIGYLHLQEGRISDAQTALQLATQLLPQDAYAWLNLGLVQFSNKQIGLARISFRKATQLKPNLAAAWNGLGSTFLREAQELATKAPGPDRKGVYPPPAPELLNLAKEAETAYRQAILHQQNAPLYHQQLGSSLLLQQQYDAAQRAYQTGLSISGSYPGLLNDMGVLLLKQFKYEDATRFLLQAVEQYNAKHSLKPNDENRIKLASALYNVGISFEGTKDKLNEATQAYHRYTQLMPQDADGFCRLGQVLKENKKKDLAIAAYVRCFQLNPPDADEVKRILRRLGHRIK